MSIDFHLKLPPNYRKILKKDPRGWANIKTDQISVDLSIVVDPRQKH